MEKKKTEKADLENKKGLFFQIGLVATLAIVLFAFEWKTYDAITVNLASIGPIEEEEMVIQTEREPPPPPPPPPPIEIMEIEIVEDHVEVEEVIIDQTVDERTVVEVYIAPVIVEEAVVEEDIIFTIVEENAGFPGGDEARQRFLGQNINYPSLARETGIQGTIIITFVVERDGSVTDVKVIRGIGGGCDEEAIRVVQSMPKWTPGRQRGKPVRVQFTMPIRFTLAG